MDSKTSLHLFTEKPFDLSAGVNNDTFNLSLTEKCKFMTPFE